MPKSVLKRIAVVAHFDPDCQLADHTKRFISQLISFCDLVILVTTSGIDERNLTWSGGQPHLRLIVRPNIGYDFMSYKSGITEAQDLIDDNTEVIICNDSFIGITTPLESLWSRMSNKSADFWGITLSHEVSSHVQSYFMVFRPAVTTSAVFRDFWSGIQALPSKAEVVSTYEIGLTKRLVAAGFKPAAYYQPRVRDKWEALVREQWRWHPSGLASNPAVNTARLVKAVITRRGWDPTIYLADRVLSGALPVLKLIVLRQDPARLGATYLLQECEARYPELYSGARAFVNRTASRYDSGDPLRLESSALRSTFEKVRYRQPIKRNQRFSRNKQLSRR